MCDSIEEATTEEEMAAEIEAREAYERFKANKVIEQREAEQVEVKKTNEIAIGESPPLSLTFPILYFLLFDHIADSPARSSHNSQRGSLHRHRSIPIDSLPYHR